MYYFLSINSALIFVHKIIYSNTMHLYRTNPSRHSSIADNNRLPNPPQQLSACSDRNMYEILLHYIVQLPRLLSQSTKPDIVNILKHDAHIQRSPLSPTVPVDTVLSYSPHTVSILLLPVIESTSLYLSSNQF